MHPSQDTAGAEEEEEEEGEEEEAEADIEPGRPPRKGSVAWYKERLQYVLFPGSATKLCDWVVGCIARKVSNNESRKSFEGWVRAIANAAPAGHIIPSSWHLYKGIAGVLDIRNHVHHFCPCARHRYAQIPATQASYREHAADTCPVCEHVRFLKDMQGRLRPAKWVFYLGVELALRLYLFSNPDFVELRGKGRDEGAHTFWESKEAARLNEALEGALFNEDNSPYSLFIDFFEVYRFRQHSTGCVFLRSNDLGGEYASLRQFHVALMIIPGPQAPALATTYSQLIAADFAACMRSLGAPRLRPKGRGGLGHRGHLYADGASGGPTAGCPPFGGCALLHSGGAGGVGKRVLAA